jgi:phage repressor protein C with HTH and peptisase S24 domain
MEGEIADLKEQLADLALRASSGGEGGGGRDWAGDGNELPASAEEVKNKEVTNKDSEANNKVAETADREGARKGAPLELLLAEVEEEQGVEEAAAGGGGGGGGGQEDGAAAEMQREEVEIARESARESERGAREEVEIEHGFAPPAAAAFGRPRSASTPKPSPRV